MNVIRFPAELPFSKWPAVDLVYGKMIAGDWVGARAAYEANEQDIKDAIGAGNYWREKFNQGVPVDDGPTITIGAAFQPVTWKPGVAQCFAIVGEGAGNGSASIEEGGQGLYGGVFDVKPTSVLLSQFSTWGAKAVNGLTVRAGQFLVCYSEAPTELPGRADAL